MPSPDYLLPDLFVFPTISWEIREGWIFRNQLCLPVGRILFCLGRTGVVRREDRRKDRRNTAEPMA